MTAALTRTGAVIKRNRSYWTAPIDPSVSPERVQVLRRADVQTSIKDDPWFVVRYDDGGRICMHASRLGNEVPA